MKRILSVIILVVVLVGCVKKETSNDGPTYFHITNNGRIVETYIDGDDVTKEVMSYQENVETTICQFLNRKRSDLKFDLFCLLEDEGATVDVSVDEKTYTFTCDTDGAIVSAVKIVRQ